MAWNKLPPGADQWTSLDADLLTWQHSDPEGSEWNKEPAAAYPWGRYNPLQPLTVWDIALGITIWDLPLPQTRWDVFFRPDRWEKVPA